MSSFNKHHHTFLQNLLFKELVSAKELKDIYAKCFDKRVGSFNDREVHDLIKELNSSLQLAQLAIKSRLCEDTNEEFFALITLIESEAAKHSSKFSALELELLKRILKEVLTAESGTVSSIDCINYSSDIQKLGKSEAQHTLEKLIASKWLKEENGEVSLTVRSLLELEPTLKKIDVDLPMCKLCGLLTVKGSTCSSCSAKVHRHCLSRITKGNQTVKCPNCRKPWANVDATFVSPLEASQSQSQSQRVSSTPANGDRSTRRGIKKRPIESDSESD